jgi:hypothetical protein
MMHRSKSLLLIALPALCCTAWPWRTHAGPIDPPPPATTIDVTRVLGAGMAKVTVFLVRIPYPWSLTLAQTTCPLMSQRPSQGGLSVLPLTDQQ